MMDEELKSNSEDLKDQFQFKLYKDGTVALVDVAVLSLQAM